MPTTIPAKILAFLKRWLFLGCFVVWFFLSQLKMTGLGSFLRIPTYNLYQLSDYTVPILLLVRIVFFQTYSRKQLAAVIALTAVFAVSAWLAKPWELLMVWLFLAAARDQDADELVKAGYLTLLCATIFVVISFFLGRIEEVSGTRAQLSLTRHSWGYGHPNTLGAVVLQLAACRLYLHRNSLRMEDFILTAGAMAFVYAVPNSQSSAICLLMLLALALICLVWPRLPQKLRRPLLGCFLPAAVFCNLFTVFTSLCYRPGGWLEPINELLSTRPSCANRIYSIYGVSLFGRRLARMYTQAEYNGVSFYMPWLDSSYMNLLLRFGLLSYFSYSALYLLGMRRVRKAGNVMLLGILTIYAAHAVMETSLYSPQYNLFPIVMFAALQPPAHTEIPSHNFIGT